LKPLGNNYTRLGDYNTALYMHSKALELARQRQDQQAMAGAWSNMATCARWKGDLPAATQYAEAGLGVVLRPSPLYGLLLSTRAEILAEEGRYDTAARVIGQALQVLSAHRPEAAGQYWQGSALQTAALIALRRGRNREALQYARNALQWWQRLYPDSRQREKAKTAILLGDIYKDSKDLTASLQAYQQALVWLLPAWRTGNAYEAPPIELLYSESMLTDALTGKAAVLAALQQPDKALQHYNTVFNAVHRLQGAYFNTAAKLKELELTKSRADAAMQLAYSIWKKTNQPVYKDQMLLIAEWSKAQVLAQERSLRAGSAVTGSDTVARRMQQLEEAIAYYQRELATGSKEGHLSQLLQSVEYDLSLLRRQVRQQAGVPEATTLLTARRIQEFLHQLPDHVTVLEFFAGRDSSFIIEADHRTVTDIIVIPHSARLQDSITRYMQRWYMQGPSAMLNAPRAFFEESAGIYGSIFGNYAWQKGRQYLLIPDGLFSYLPFDALPTQPQYSHQFAAWPFLIKQVSLSQAWSLQTWYQQQSALYKNKGFTGFFITKGKQGRQPALSVQEEYTSMRGLVKGDYYLDSMATWQQFTEQAGQLGVVHISSHAVSAQSDSFPYLQLYDQPFYLFDLQYRRFSPALVVLGACKTADGAWLDGEGVNSLGRGFTAAGAGGVVSGLWNVHDESARQLLPHFYQQLALHKNAAEALNQAKLQWLQDQNMQPALQLPYYWAALQYSGHLQPITLEQTSAGAASRAGLYWAVALVILTIILLFKRYK